MPQLYLNNFTTTFIASVKSAPATANPAAELDYGILRVSDGAAGTLINPPAGSWYVLTSYKRSGTVESDYEILRVTGVDNSVVGECRLTVLRGQEGTTPKAYVAGDLVELRLTAGGISQYAQTTDPRMSDSRAPTGAAGGVLSGTFPNPGFAQPMATVAQMEGRVEKVAGKGLSANDYTNADLAKLAGIAEQASKNAPDSQLRDRSTHTGVQAISTVTDLQATLDAKEPGIAAGTAAQYWRGDKTWRDFAAEVRATVLTSLSTASNTAIAAGDTVLAALGKAQAQLAAHFGAGGGAHAAATTSAAGFLSAGDKAKLDGVGYGATANATDAQLRDRASHTGSQAISTVAGLQTALDTKPSADRTRERLTAPRAYYVRSDGNDSNTGLGNSAGGAFATIQKAVDVVTGSVDLGGFDVTIYVGAGNWTASTSLRTVTGRGTIIIRGINSDMVSTVISTTGSDCFFGSFVGRYHFEWIKLQTSNSGYCIYIQGGSAYATWANLTFGPSAFIHVTAGSGASLEAVGSYTIVGSAIAHLSCYDCASARISSVAITIAGTPNWSYGFAVAERASSILVTGVSFSGPSTGYRYRASLNGVITTNSGESYLPGNTAGITASGGQYS